MGKISCLLQMLLDFANDTEEGLDFFTYLSDDSAPKTLFVPLNSGFTDNEVSKQGMSGHPKAHGMNYQSPREVCQSWHGGDVK